MCFFNFPISKKIVQGLVCLFIDAFFADVAFFATKQAPSLSIKCPNILNRHKHRRQTHKKGASKKSQRSNPLFLFSLSSMLPRQIKKH